MRSRIGFGLLMGLSLLHGGATWGTQVVPLTEVELTERSSLIVIGRCTEVRSAWMGRRLMTLATIAVHEVLKGAPREQVTVVIPGGIDAQRPVPVAAVVADAPQLAPAEELVLFLSAQPDERDQYTVTGWAQGKFSIVRDAAGGEVVALHRRQPSPPGTLGRRTPQGRAETLPLARFRARILHRVEQSLLQP